MVLIRLAKEFGTHGMGFSRSSGYIQPIPSLQDIRWPWCLLTLEVSYALLNSVLGWKEGKLQCSTYVKRKAKLPFIKVYGLEKAKH